MVIEHRLSRGRDADDVGHGALAEVRHRALVDQALLLERAQVLIKREHDPRRVSDRR